MDHDRRPLGDRVREAEALAKKEEFTGEARLLNESILEDDPRNVDALTRLGRICAEAGRLDLAEDAWRRAVLIDPENRIARNNLSTLDRRRLRAAELARHEDEARHLTDAAAVQRGAKAASLSGDVGRAAAFYLRASVLDPSRATEYRIGAAAALRKLGEGQRAEELLLEVLADEPQNEHALTALAAVFRSRREPDRARLLLEGLLRRRPWDGGALAALAGVYADLGRTEDAMEAFRRSGLSFADAQAYRRRRR